MKLLHYLYYTIFNFEIRIAYFEWSRVRLTLGAILSTHSSVVERSIAEGSSFVLLHHLVTAAPQTVATT